MLYHKILKDPGVRGRLDLLREGILQLINDLDNVSPEKEFKNSTVNNIPNFSKIMKIINDKTDYNNLITLTFSHRVNYGDNRSLSPMMSDVLSSSKYTLSILNELIASMKSDEYEQVETLKNFLNGVVVCEKELYYYENFEEITVGQFLSSYIFFIERLNKNTEGVDHKLKLLDIYHKNNSNLIEMETYLEFVEKYQYITFITPNDVVMANHLFKNNFDELTIYNISNSIDDVENYFKINAEEIILLFMNNFDSLDCYCEFFIELYNIYCEEISKSLIQERSVDISAVMNSLEKGLPLKWVVELSIK